MLQQNLTELNEQVLQKVAYYSQQNFVCPRNSQNATKLDPISKSGRENEDKQRGDEMIINMFYFELIILWLHNYFYHFELQLQISFHAPWLRAACGVFTIFLHY